MIATTTTMRSACLVCVLVVIIGCLTETRAYVSFDQVNPDNSSVSDADLPKSTVPEQEKPKLTRVPLEPRRSRRAIDGSLATINENDGGKPGRVAERPVTEDVAQAARPGAKRNHKKMKLAQTQARKKSKKTKRYIDTAAGRQLVDNQDRSFRAGSHKDEQYYAQRKAIMDRYYARNREIARKYQQGTTEGPFRYNLGFGSPRTENHWFQSKTIAQPPNATPPPRVLARAGSSTMSTLDAFGDRGSASEESESNEYEEHEIDDLDAAAEPESETEVLVGHATTTVKPSTTAQPKRPRITNENNIQKVGKCDTPESVHMLYQNNLVLNIQRNTAVEAKIYPPTEEGSCVVCIIAEQISGEHQKIEVDHTEKVANVRVQGIQNGQILIAVRFYTDRENRDRCSRLQ